MSGAEKLEREPSYAKVSRKKEKDQDWKIADWLYSRKFNTVFNFLMIYSEQLLSIPSSEKLNPPSGPFPSPLLSLLYSHPHIP